MSHKNKNIKFPVSNLADHQFKVVFSFSFDLGMLVFPLKVEIKPTYCCPHCVSAVDQDWEDFLMELEDEPKPQHSVHCSPAPGTKTPVCQIKTQ